MKRRSAIKTLAGAMIAPAFLRGASLAAPPRSKPNLLFIICDELRYDSMAAYGNRMLRVPNLNKLAGESVVYKNAYVSQPVCTPSRSTLLTGLWPHSNGCTANNIPLKPSARCLPQLLDDPRYRTAYYGKWHLGDEVFPQHGFEEWISIEDMYRHHYSAGRDQNAKSSYWHYLDDLGYRPGKDGFFSRNFARGLAFEHSKLFFLQKKACEFLDQYHGNPSVLYVSFLAPHMPFTGPFNALCNPEEYNPYGLYLPSNMDALPGPDDPLRYRLLQASMKRSAEAWRKVTANYWGLITEIDLSVGMILKRLEDLGLVENTLVVFTTDHGDMMASHGMIAKTVMYQEAVRVPLIMRVPWVEKAGRVVTEPVSDIDIVPTVLDLLGKAPPHNLQGSSVRDVIEGKIPAKDVFIEWSPQNESWKADAPDSIKGVSPEARKRAAGAHIRTVITPEGWKLCWCDQDKSQLFNLRDDPGETRNLFYSGRHRDVISSLTEKIRRWQQATGDSVKLG